uniref:Retrotransposon gag domain-containing protein n=1 Tax=Moniliophthora roreri TaxID=221103 RepID=A0A0W0F2M0_MONRR
MTMQQTSPSLQDLISALRMLMNGEKKKENKVAVPNSYDGSPAKASTFLTKVDLYLMANDTLYPNNKDKILFTLSYMKEGHAAQWMKAKTDEYKRTLREKEAEPHDTKPEDIGTDARLKMELLKQNKKHVDEYITDFRLLAIDSKYDDKALIDYFLAELHPALLKSCLLQPDQPDTIEGWYD